MMPYSGLTGIAEWEQRALAIVRRIEELVDSTSGPLRIWMHNALAAAMFGAAPGEIVEGGTLTREEMMMYSAMFQATLAFRSTPIVAYLDEQGQPVLMTPDAITGYRPRPVSAVEPLGGGLGSMGSAPRVSPLPLSAAGEAARPTKE